MVDHVYVAVRWRESNSSRVNPTVIGDPTTVLVDAFITETVFDPQFVTYISLLDGAKATPHGKLPTAIVPTTVLVEVLITETLASPLVGM